MELFFYLFCVLAFGILASEVVRIFNNPDIPMDRLFFEALLLAGTIPIAWMVNEYYYGESQPELGLIMGSVMVWFLFLTVFHRWYLKEVKV